MHGVGSVTPGVVSFAPAVPRDVPLVVRGKARTVVPYVLVLGCVVILAAMLAAIPVLLVLFTSVPGYALLLIMPMAMQLGFSVLVLRELRGLRGPQLAADHTGVWVRTGMGAKPEAVFLPWAAIDGIDTGRRGRAVRIMSGRGAELYGRRPRWRAGYLRRRLGTPFVVDGRHSTERPEAIVFRLHQLAAHARLS
jgi:hypothetical protein